MMGQATLIFEMEFILSSFVLRSSAKLLFFFHSSQIDVTWSLYEKAKMRGFSDTYFPVYRQNRIRISQNIDRIYNIPENADTILSIYRKIRTRENPCIDIFHPVRYRNNFSYVNFNLTLNWVMYIYVLYFDLANFSSCIEYSLNKAIMFFPLTI